MGKRKTLFDAGLAEEMKRRVLLLEAQSQRQWGRMTVAEMPAHCRAGLGMAMGLIRPRRAPFPGNVIGILIKPLVLRGGQPMRRNSPSAPELFAVDGGGCELERERAGLLAAIDAFVEGGAGCCSMHPHPFFGLLKPEEWAGLMYQHLDHQLRQFGV